MLSQFNLKSTPQRPIANLKFAQQNSLNLHNSRFLKYLKPGKGEIYALYQKIG